MTTGNTESKDVASASTLSTTPCSAFVGPFFDKSKPLTSAVDNVIASRMGRIAVIAGDKDRTDVGDSIDRGLVLLRLLDEIGLSVILKPDGDTGSGSEWFGLRTTGEWIDFVILLGRILARDQNARGVNELAYSGRPEAVACGIATFLMASEAQKEEAFSLVGKSTEEREMHFLQNHSHIRA